MKLVKLTQGMETIVDDDDFERVSKHKWYLGRFRGGSYALRTATISTKNRRTIFLHRFIMEAKVGEQVDHIFGNTLDNRKSQLRLCTHGENIQNQKLRKDNKLGIKGVRLHGGKYEANIRYKGKGIYLGRFENKEDARNAYLLASKKYHGAFSRIQ